MLRHRERAMELRPFVFGWLSLQSRERIPIGTPDATAHLRLPLPGMRIGVCLRSTTTATVCAVTNTETLGARGTGGIVT
jgi:hypothetical protein